MKNPKFTKSQVKKLDALIKKLNDVFNGMPSIEEIDTAETVEEVNGLLLDREDASVEFNAIREQIKYEGNDVKFANRLGLYFLKYDANGDEVFCVRREISVVDHQFITARDTQQALAAAEEAWLKENRLDALPDPTFSIAETNR